MANLANLADLFHHRWTVPTIAELHRGRGAKMVTLVHRLAVNRGALRQTLNAAIGSGWVIRNPGYGHPLRPEYILTDAGERIGPACREFMEAVRKRGVERVMLRKWSSPVLCTVALGCLRFAEIKNAHPGVSDRALAMTLKQLLAAKLLQRRLRDDFPPSVEWRPRPASRAIVEALKRLSAA